MKTTLLATALAACSFIAQAATVTLGWNKSPDPTVVGYRMYQGGASRSYTNVTSVGLVTNMTEVNLTVGSTYFFAVTCFTAVGLESDYSAELRYTVPLTIPVITTQPVGSTNATGSSFTFSVVATGASLTYQWFKDGVALGGATGSTLTVSSLTWANNGNYTVTVSNPSGSVVSKPALLAVIPLPPTGLTVGP